MMKALILTNLPKTFVLSTALLSFSFAQEVLLKEVEVKAKKETAQDSLEVRQVRESSARDVGEALQVVPGLHFFRKGGIANEIVLRSFRRDNIRVEIDDLSIHGACPNRMDPPEAHVDFSEVSKIDIVKGPFAVNRPNILGGAVFVELKKPKRGFHVDFNLGAGSFNFINPSLNISYADSKLFGLAGFSYRYAKPYKDGDGKKITEVYPENSPNRYKPDARDSKAFEIKTGWARFGFSPVDKHELEIAYTRQEMRHVLYPALLMDGIKDDADRLNIKYKVKDLFNFNFYYSKVEHWMDDRYRASSNNTPRGYSMATDAKTKAYGINLEAKLFDFKVGLNAYRRNWDAINYMWNQQQLAYRSQNMIPDVDITGFGIFGEYDKQIMPKLRLKAGLRLDTVKSEADSSKANTDLYFAYHSTRSTSKTDTFPSGNVQLSYTLGNGLELFAGIGHSVRVSDQQERYIALQRMCNPPTNINCAWVGNPKLKPSKNTELDVGLKYQGPKGYARATLFYSHVDDYIYVYKQNVVNPNMMNPNGAQAYSYTNIDARFFGFEVSSLYNLMGNFFLSSALSYVDARKDTDASKNITDKDVAETPPLTARVSLRYDTGLWFVEPEFVATSTQSKVDSDLKEQETSGYGIVNIKVGANYKNFTLTAGVDNVFDRKYYSHLSYIRNPFASGVRVPEPGRNFYITASYSF